MRNSLTTSKKISLQFTIFSAILLCVFGILVNIIFFLSWYALRDPERPRHDDDDESSFAVHIPLHKEFPRHELRFDPDDPEVEELLDAKLWNWVAKLDDYYLHYVIAWDKVIIRNISSQIEAQMALLRVTLVLILVGSAFAYGFSFLFVKKALKKLKKLNQALEKLDIDHLNQPLLVEGNPKDEINKVSQKFNLALAKIQRQTLGLKDFIKNASHELKTPLMTIFTLSDLARKTKDYEIIIKKIKAEAKSMDQLLETLLLITQIEDKTELPKQELNLSQSLKGLLEQYQLTYQEKNLNFISDFPPSLIKKVHPQGRITIVSNLLSNACKFTPQGGTIQISLNDQELKIADTWPGISKEQQEKIWERFWQAEESHTDTKSFGLGLYLAQLFTQKQGFQLAVSSVFGQGTTFILKF